MVVTNSTDLDRPLPSESKSTDETADQSGSTVLGLRGGIAKVENQFASKKELRGSGGGFLVDLPNDIGRSKTVVLQGNL